MTKQQEFWRKRELDCQLIQMILKEKKEGWKDKAIGRLYKFHGDIIEYFGKDKAV